MMNTEDLNNRRARMQENVNGQEMKRAEGNKEETRQQTQNNTPEVLTNPIYTPAFLRTQIGRLMQVEFRRCRSKLYFT